MSNQTTGEISNRTEIEDSRLEMLFQKVSAEYDRNNPEEHLFLEAMEYCVKASVHSRNKNKPAYFSGNQQADRNERIRTFLDREKNSFFTLIPYIVAGVFALFAEIISTQKIVSVIVSFLFVAWVLFSVWITMRSEKNAGNFS